MNMLRSDTRPDMRIWMSQLKYKNFRTMITQPHCHWNMRTDPITILISVENKQTTNNPCLNNYEITPASMHTVGAMKTFLEKASVFICDFGVVAILQHQA